MELNTKEDLLKVISELIENDKAREAKLQTIEETVSSINTNGDTKETPDNEETTDNEQLSDEEVDELTQLLMTD